MKERGIIFSDPMVRANLEGRKTQTRRTRGLNEINAEPKAWDKPFFNQKKGIWEFLHLGENKVVELKCPYGVVGDVLYVRECWAVTRLEGPMKTLEYPNVLYRADSSTQLILEQPKLWDYCVPKESFKWRPSIHMPKWASRIKLEITDIRVERVQDISLEDCKAEGVSDDPREDWRELFMELWDSINAKRGYGWESNPWVWVISYRKL